MLTDITLFMGTVAFVVIPTVWLMRRVIRAEGRTLERLREEWEVGGRQEPWRYDIGTGDVPVARGMWA